ncbi:MAG TPA: hypothetical protein VGK99_08105 [Acidobacteriota bacterium]|jgi:hypothetical protein
MNRKKIALVFLCAWFALHAAYLLRRGIPQMTEEWKKFGHVGTDLQKRAISYLGWAELVDLLRRRVPPGSTLLFVTGMEKTSESYFSFLLNYEIYPQRHEGLVAFQAGLRPRFVVAYIGLPKEIKLEQYREIYRSRYVQLWEKRP